MVEQITKEVLNSFRKDFQDTVKDLEEKYGMVIKLGNISYSTSSFTGKVEVRLNSVSPTQKFEDAFKACYMFYGLDEDVLGKTFIGLNGVTLKFVGIDNKKRSYPCICEGNNGKSYKLSVDQLKYHLEKAKQTV